MATRVKYNPFVCCHEMAVKHGFLPEFVPGTEEWGSYVERAEHYFVANGVDTQETRRAVLLSSCGAPTYRLIRNLSTPLKPGEKTYKEIVELVASHLPQSLQLLCSGSNLIPV